MVLQDFFSKSNLMDKNGTTALPLVLTYMISSSSLVLPTTGSGGAVEKAV